MTSSLQVKPSGHVLRIQHPISSNTHDFSIHFHTQPQLFRHNPCSTAHGNVRTPLEQSPKLQRYTRQVNPQAKDQPLKRKYRYVAYRIVASTLLRGRQLAPKRTIEETSLQCPPFRPGTSPSEPSTTNGNSFATVQPQHFSHVIIYGTFQ